MTRVADVTDGASPRFRRPEWVAHVIDEAADPPRAVLLHLPSGRRTGLSDTATRIWREVVASGAEGVHVGGITEIVAPEYGVNPTIITHDVVALLDDMVAGEWVEMAPEQDASEPRLTEEVAPEHEGGGHG